MTLSESIQERAFKEINESGARQSQNRRILELLKSNEKVPINQIKFIASQYNRSVDDIRKGRVDGYCWEIVSFKENGVWYKSII